MIDDDLDPRKPIRKPKPLDNYSVDELREYIQILKDEIMRAQSDIAKKIAHRDAISGLFKIKED